MNNSTVFDELDLAIEQLIADPDAPREAPEPAMAGLLEIASDLCHVPDPAFKMKLREHFLQGGAVSHPLPAAEWRRIARAPASEPEILPTLSGRGYGAYPVRPANFAASVALHVALALLAALGLFLMKSSPRVLSLRPAATVHVSAYISPEGPAPQDGGGSGGTVSKTGASMGMPPRFASRQIVPPVVVIANQKPLLTADPTIVGIPQPELLKAQTGDPLSALIAPSNGRGLHGGVGSGSRGGVGDGDGPGAGPGSGGGSGGGPFSAGRGISAPRLLYSPEPAFTDEARKAKYQGTVGLWAVVGVDGQPHNLVVSRSLGMGLDESALETVRTWRFEPGTKDGRPVPVWMYIEVNFRLY